MNMWLGMKRAMMVIEWAKKAYDNGNLKVVKVGKLLQDQAALINDKDATEHRARAAEKRVKAAGGQLSKMRGSLEAVESATKKADATKEAVQVVLAEAK